MSYIKLYKEKDRLNQKEDDVKSDPHIQYYLQCKHELNVVLPILDKIVNQTLCLQNYTLSPGHCKGLAKACGLFLKNEVTRVLFNNCGIDGKEFASILEGLTQLSNFRSIIYKKN